MWLPLCRAIEKPSFSSTEQISRAVRAWELGHQTAISTVERLTETWGISSPSATRSAICSLIASCPPLQGCYSQGDTYEEAVENIKDAIKLHIEDRLSEGEEIPQVSVSLSTVEIAV